MLFNLLIKLSNKCRRTLTPVSRTYPTSLGRTFRSILLLFAPAHSSFTQFFLEYEIFKGENSYFSKHLMFSNV